MRPRRPYLTDQPAQLMSMFHAQPSPPADITVKEGDSSRSGTYRLKCFTRPAILREAICLYVDGVVFTGDTLFVGGVGRTDLQGGSWETLVSSIRNKLFSLPDATVALPGHNYGEAPKSTIGVEKVHNPYVGSHSY